ncbi:MAG: DUF3108 domain-containing protein [Acidobacteria bacterium]|nr:DUF3108 domain-containing protein [Acidobacteriota bacterium]
MNMSRTLAAALVALTTALVVTTSTPTAQADLPVPFKPGEALTYDVSWTTFLTAGQATLSVKERRAAGPGRTQYYLVAEGQPSSMLQKLYHLYYKAESMMDTKTLRPASATLYSDENGRKRYKTSIFRGNGMVDYEVKTASTAKSTLKIPATAQDPLGAIYVLRAIPLKPGQAPFTIPVVDSGKAYTMRVTVGARESVKTGIGTLPAIKLTLAVTGPDGKATDAPMTMWVSDDARRLPLKFMAGLTVGSFQLTLAKAVG